MTTEAGSGEETLALIHPDADHEDAEAALLEAGWTRCGAGDWAIALSSPDGRTAARISPFDPAGAYNTAFYREAAPTGQVPALFGHRRLMGGGDLQILELLEPVPEDHALRFTRTIQQPGGALLEVALRIHERMRREQPWPGPLDLNPTNVMRRTDGQLVMMDVFALDGPRLYGTVATDPDLVAATIPQSQRRFIAEIPLATTGGRDDEQMRAIRAALDGADARRRAGQPRRTTPRPR
ncbi:hypothetical protein ACFVDI_04980 [Nocardioides sp. NPDC057767]|uniref:hypothetical protein n=1 Tax=unclassified Nocardioides TaxID=2615069 RepID=UPI00366A75C8